MRVISGMARGRRLIAPAGLDVRPTSDRVRQSIFDMLAVRGIGDSVLDLFAGSGALGIEALSRGAERAAFVDRSSNSIKAVRRNLSACGFEDKALVIATDFKAALGRLEKQNEGFELVFVDPPYEGLQRDAALARLGPVLAPGAMIVVETAATEAPPRAPESWQLDAERKFGRTTVFLYRYD